MTPSTSAYGLHRVRPERPVPIAVVGAGYWGPRIVRNALGTATPISTGEPSQSPAHAGLPMRRARHSGTEGRRSHLAPSTQPRGEVRQYAGCCGGNLRLLPALAYAGRRVSLESRRGDFDRAASWLDMFRSTLARTRTTDAVASERVQEEGVMRGIHIGDAERASSLPLTAGVAGMRAALIRQWSLATALGATV